MYNITNNCMHAWANLLQWTTFVHNCKTPENSRQPDTIMFHLTDSSQDLCKQHQPCMFVPNRNWLVSKTLLMKTKERWAVHTAGVYRLNYTCGGCPACGHTGAVTSTHASCPLPCVLHSCYISHRVMPTMHWPLPRISRSLAGLQKSLKMWKPSIPVGNVIPHLSWCATEYCLFRRVEKSNNYTY